MRVRCDGAKCYVTEVETLASGAINYFTAKFTFDSAWADFITANQLYSVFEGSDIVVISNLAYNSETQTYDCDVPWGNINSRRRTSCWHNWSYNNSRKYNSYN